ncbi:hypothetical protein HMPREF9278_0333, partial [Mobiluncus mulieris FB024-16]
MLYRESGDGVHEVPAAVAGLTIAVAVGGHQSREKLKPCDLHKPKT